MKRLSHESFPDFMDKTIPNILLKLHRDDDAIGYIQYWMNWRPLAYVDEVVIWASKGDWPFPCEQDCCFLDLTDDMRNCQFEDERIWFFVSFAVIHLVIKLRYVTVYHNLSLRTEAFLGSSCGQALPTDIGAAITYFLTGGQSAEVLYGNQLEHITHLLDFIDDEFPGCLPAILDPSLLPRNDLFNVREFIEKHGDGTLIIDTLEEILREWY